MECRGVSRARARQPTSQRRRIRRRTHEERSDANGSNETITGCPRALYLFVKGPADIQIGMGRHVTTVSTVSVVLFLHCVCEPRSKRGDFENRPFLRTGFA